VLVAALRGAHRDGVHTDPLVGAHPPETVVRASR
jgi:hypothetical protein